MRDPDDWEKWKASGLPKNEGNDNFDKMALAKGIDGVYDNSMEGIAIYNPKVLKVSK